MLWTRVKTFNPAGNPTTRLRPTGWLPSHCTDSSMLASNLSPQAEELPIEVTGIGLQSVRTLCGTFKRRDRKLDLLYWQLFSVRLCVLPITGFYEIWC